jgi:hypothetical protein
MRHHRPTRSAVLGLALVALAAPTAAAQPQNLRSPDARDSTPAAQTNVGALDRARRQTDWERSQGRISARPTPATPLPTPVRRHRHPGAARAIDRPRL